MAAPQPRRTPDRQRDAERSKRQLLEAAFDEFASHGYAGARVGRIASSAGVNKQLISYYFGGKEGLYRALQRSWLDNEAEHTGPEFSPVDVMSWYLRQSVEDPRGVRLLMWQSLNEETPEVQEQAEFDREQDWIRQRMAAGELADDLDPASLQLAFMGMTMAPALMPQVVRRLFGVEPDSEEFLTRYSRMLRRVLGRLSDHRNPPTKGSNP